MPYMFGNKTGPPKNKGGVFGVMSLGTQEFESVPIIIIYINKQTK